MSGRRGGFVLVEALIVIAGLIALMAMLAANQRAALQEMQDGLRQRRADTAARSAIARALAALQSADANLATTEDDWAVLGDKGDQAFDLGNGTQFRLQIVDAGALLNVNTATEAQLQQLPLEPEQVDSLLDWREASLQARANGAKDAYYNDLTEPYNARLARLTTLSELLLVKGWTARTLYTSNTDVVSTVTPPEDAAGNPLPLAALLTVDSGAPNTQADGTARINFAQANLNVQTLAQVGINGPQAQQIAAGAPYASFAALLGRGGINSQTAQRILDAVTFAAGNRLEGKINLNTATQAVLETLPNVTSDIASEIVSRQSSGGFTSLGELATLPGLAGAQLGQVADAFTVGSDTWIVRAYGESGGVATAIEATVGLRNNRVQVLTWNRLNTADIPAWWGWYADAASTVEAGAAS